MCAVFAAGLCAHAAEEDKPAGKIYPLGLGLYGDMQLWTEYDSVYGIDISFISWRNEVKGLSLSLVEADQKALYGFSVSLMCASCYDGYGVVCGTLGTFAEGDVYGMRLGFCNFSIDGGMTGLQIGGVNIQYFGVFSGCQLGLLASLAGGVEGVQTGLMVTITKELRGVAVGGVTITGKTHGVQIGVVNGTEELHGLQVGLINRAESGRGLQIGLVNIFKEAAVPYLPAINFHF